MSNRNNRRRYPKRPINQKPPHEDYNLHHLGNPHWVWASAMQHSLNHLRLIDQALHRRSRPLLHPFLQGQGPTLRHCRLPSLNLALHPVRNTTMDQLHAYTVAISQARTTMQPDSHASLYLRRMLAGCPISSHFHSLVLLTKRAPYSPGYTITSSTMSSLSSTTMSNHRHLNPLYHPALPFARAMLASLRP